ncbi:tetratricopeptide repeat protein [PVC group bacterium]|nr:tetratricopeptide repeat protein [PVC group bacterium]
MTRILNKINASCVCGLIFSVIMLILFSSPVNAEKSEAEIFQEICIPLAIEFLKLGSQLGQENYFIPGDSRINIDNTKNSTIYDKVLTETIVSLKKFIQKYPNSVWADDAQVIIANVLNLKPQEAVIEWGKVETNYPDGRIEAWSQENLMYIPVISTTNILLDVAMLKIGEMNYLDEQWNEALASFGNLTQRYENSPLNELPDVVRRAHFAIVRIYEKLGKTEENINYLNELIIKYPKSVMAPQARSKLKRLEERLNKSE